ncbi:hypothetical protein [uncultured Pseudacidovorax sp.]|uniref:hypothetical protein n=1 Tax=uncultured Pseudacidovorax sp. TaxID=679313 RepID=UPI0025E05E86|nr:hypothetical protein [uncultured Pseudacidovorax sp.]
MADDESNGAPRPSTAVLSMLEVSRIAEQAYGYAAWLCRDDPEPPDQFAQSVVSMFEALLADHAERNGYGFLADGYGAGVAQGARTVPALWRPG